ncbi:MAG: aminotransferase class V-fold PLP-dependent enzyme [Rhodospirillales bacterium]|nr:aminotransferase class V-fold PLP-dependent enzyme [Rhodospirillales bacterium]
MTIDVKRARDDTPGCANVIHFNNAGAALMPAPVIRAVKDHIDLEAAIGGYEAKDKRQQALDAVYTSAAKLLNCGADEIALIENATRAWDMAFYALVPTFKPGDRILTAEAEYASNYIAFLQAAKQRGVTVGVIPSEPTGEVSVKALERMIDGRVKLIAVTHVPTNGGLVNPAAAIGRVAKAAGIPYLLDACQSVGQLPVDVQAIGCDMLSATGRKYLRGPRGTGFLYVRRSLIGTLEPPLLDLRAATWTGKDTFEIRADARRFENWESNVAGSLGLGVAIDYALGLGLPAIYARLAALAERLRQSLSAVPGARIHDIGRERCGIVSFAIEGQTPEKIRDALRARAINTTVSGLSSTWLDMERRGLQSVGRASVHYYNTEDEVDRVAAAVAESMS